MELTPEERLLAALLRLTLKDAQQTRDLRLKVEALRWLWTVAPAIAQRAAVPRVEGYAVHPQQVNFGSQSA